MNEQTPHARDYGFLAGLLAGTVVGAGVALWMTPSATAEARGRLNASASRLRDQLRSKSDGIRDQVAGAVARGAHEVEQFAAAANNDRHNL
jgi:gas vesicle protein